VTGPVPRPARTPDRRPIRRTRNRVPCPSGQNDPLGPALSLLTFPLAAYAGFVLVRGQAVRMVLPATSRRIIVVAVVVLFALNWTPKLLWLGV
jgi:hypothetical protein